MMTRALPVLLPILVSAPHGDNTCYRFAEAVI